MPFLLIDNLAAKSLIRSPLSIFFFEFLRFSSLTDFNLAFEAPPAFLMAAMRDDLPSVSNGICGGDEGGNGCCVDGGGGGGGGTDGEIDGT